MDSGRLNVGKAISDFGKYGDRENLDLGALIFLKKMENRQLLNIFEAETKLVQMEISEPTLKEQMLVERLKNGESGAFSELYDDYSRALYGVIFQITSSKSESEHLLQDTFVKIWRNIARYDATKGRLFTWLVVVARRLALDFMRSAYGAQKKLIQNDDTLVNFGSHAPEMTQLDHLGLEKSVESLDPKLKQVIDLQYFLGYSQQEVADELNMPLGTVKSRTRAAFMHLRKQLTAEGL